ncbi:MAG: hypothetical protein ACI4F4_04010 [Lachnospiraceae bacterium]
MEYVALVTIIIACIVLPIILITVFLIKEEEGRIKQVIFLVSAVILYLVMQWGLKEKGLQWLYNHKHITGFDMMKFTSNHHLLHLFLVSLAGALFLYGVSCILFRFVWKRNYSFRNILYYSLGYCTCEACMLAGIRSIRTIIVCVKGTEGELASSVTELFLSSYERILIMMIQTALLVMLAYFIQKRHSMAGFMISLFVGTFVSFLPAFFILFSTAEFLELYSRTVALIIVYSFLTVAAITGIVIILNLIYAFETKNIQKK